MAITNTTFGAHRFLKKDVKEAIDLLIDKNYIVYNEDDRLILNRNKI
tara:strand:+ start:60 stop:200 length:141 start_codon:yes stop_codon:yes gene_type:complete